MPKRKFIRAATDILVDLFSADALMNTGRGCIVNISLGGIAIETESSFELDRELLVYAKLPNTEKPLEIHAKVVRQQNLGNIRRYGLKYTKVTAVERIKLFAYVHGWLEKLKTKETRNGNNI